MTFKEISNIRLVSQKIGSAEFTKPGEIVSWMGAIQAQDYQMAKWAVGMRISGSTDNSIEDSFNKGEILRTHLMRPTWHFISPEDVYWMLELTAPQVKSAMKSREKVLELDRSVIYKSNQTIVDGLATYHILSRDELAKRINFAGINTDNNRLSHILVNAELDGLICSGPVKSNKLTYSLLSERVPYKKSLTRDESLAELASRYFNSHSPATLKDFAWWSGLSVKDCRLAWDYVKPYFITEFIGKEKYLIPNSFRIPENKNLLVYFLPSYDEFLISYKDRSASLSLVDNKKTISVNGIFYPVIIINGQVKGNWRRVIKNGLLNIEMTMFEKISKSAINQIAKSSKKLGEFLNKDVYVTYT